MSLTVQIIVFSVIYLTCGVLIATLAALTIPDTDEDGFTIAMCLWPLAGIVVIIYIVSHYSYMLVSRHISKFVRRDHVGKSENS